jgi:hypothetical protein
MRKPTKRDTSPRFTDKPRDVNARIPLANMLPKGSADNKGSQAPNMHGIDPHYAG